VSRAYIVGVREFWGIDFAVTPRPHSRPETEFIVEEALEILNSFELEAPKIADIGTGCGNIAVSLAHRSPMLALRRPTFHARRWPSPPATQSATRSTIDQFRHDLVSR
jgi:hypothetical protein